MLQKGGVIPLRSKLVISIGLLGLLCFVLPGSLRADDFTFSFTNTIGNTPGTVTGEILGLTNNTVGPATTVILESYPASLSVNPFLAAPPYTVTTEPWFVASVAPGGLPGNQFTEAFGVITRYNFDSSQLDTGVGIVYAALQMYTTKNPVTLQPIIGAALTACGDAVEFIRPILPRGLTQPPSNLNCMFVQTEGRDVVTFTPIVSAVPEPGTADLMLLGIGLVFVMRKRIAQGLHQATCTRWARCTPRSPVPR